jgi:hypothetical protein
MNTQAKAVKVKTALGLTHLSVAQMMANATHYVQQMTGNAWFPSPNPTLATVTAQTGTLSSAYNLALTRVKGSSAAMNQDRKTLHVTLMALAAYVENIANANPAKAVEILQSSGMPEKKQAVRTPKKFSVVNGKLKGTVILNTKAVKGSAYIYQMTTDPNTPSSWTTIYTGPKVKFTKTGLTSTTHYFFREAINVKGIQGDWSAALDLVTL